MSQAKPAVSLDFPFVPPINPLRAAVEALAHALAAEPASSDDVALDVEVGGFRVICCRTAGRPSVPLSPREREIVQLIAAGHPNKIVADVLEISEWTVCTHLRRMFAKLHVTSRAALVARVAGGVGTPESRRTDPAT